MKSCWRFSDGANPDVGEKGVAASTYLVLVPLMGHLDRTESHTSISNIIIMESNKKKKKNVPNHDTKHTCLPHEL